MEALSSLESLLLAALTAAALVVALWSARRAIAAGSAPVPTGEIVWSAVALAVLVGVAAAVGFGGPHGG